ncbi:uncharacterized protein LOC130686472 [Daphnia carinata]|uniref:uncharacterized protein LOC130686472 n=1 Tax=Daphnia carinata TaxID=120202 RepID=UPI00257BF1E6|nr:uncharacterized protein LOC130686472 [Daphnia carinata]
MPGQSGCFVPYCDTGRKGCIGKRTVFSVPRDVEMLKKWKEVVPTSHRELGPNDKICHVHFAEDDIRKGLKVVVGGKEDIFPMLWRLKPTAIPSIFPSKSLEPNLIPEGHRSKRVRKGPRIATHISAKYARTSASTEHSTKRATTKALNTNDNPSTQDQESNPETNTSRISSRLNLSDNDAAPKHSITPSNENSPRVSAEKPGISNTTSRVTAGNNKSLVDPQDAKLPPSWNWHAITLPRKRLVCLLPALPPGEAIIDKAIEIATKNSVIYYVFGKRFDSVDLEYHFQSLNEFQEILNNFDKAKTCDGCMDSATVDVKFCSTGRFQGGVWRSNKCQLLDKSSCYECVKLKNMLETRARRVNKTKKLDSFK